MNRWVYLQLRELGRGFHPFGRGGKKRSASSEDEILASETKKEASGTPKKKKAFLREMFGKSSFEAATQRDLHRKKGGKSRHQGEGDWQEIGCSAPCISVEWGGSTFKGLKRLV